MGVGLAGQAQTYYVGDSSGTCGTVHYYGSSNGIAHRTIENAERNCAAGCDDVWLNWSDGSGRVAGSFNGVCLAPAERSCYGKAITPIPRRGATVTLKAASTPTTPIDASTSTYSDAGWS